MADIPTITAQGGKKAAQHVIKRHIMIAGYDKCFQPRSPQFAQPCRSLAELTNACALREIAADNHQVGATFLQPGGGGVDDPGVVRAEMNIGQMGDASHG